MRQEASTYHRCFPPVFHMYGTEEKHGLCGNFLGKESQMKAPFPCSTRQSLWRQVLAGTDASTPDFVNAPPKLRLGHPTFRLITIYNSVLSICNLHCRQGYKSCLWRIHICGSCYISSDNIWFRGLCIYIYHFR